MTRDRPGQTLMPFMPPDARIGDPAASFRNAKSGAGADDQAAAASALCKALPAKHTCNLREASILLGSCTRTVMRLIEDGTLLCQYANAQLEAERRHARPVMRLPRPFDAAREKFLSVEELRLRNSNLQG